MLGGSRRSGGLGLLQPHAERCEGAFGDLDLVADRDRIAMVNPPIREGRFHGFENARGLNDDACGATMDGFIVLRQGCLNSVGCDIRRSSQNVGDETGVWRRRYEATYLVGGQDDAVANTCVERVVSKTDRRSDCFRRVPLFGDDHLVNEIGEFLSTHLGSPDPNLSMSYQFECDISFKSHEGCRQENTVFRHCFPQVDGVRTIEKRALSRGQMSVARRHPAFDDPRLQTRFDHRDHAGMRRFIEALPDEGRLASPTTPRKVRDVIS